MYEHNVNDFNTIISQVIEEMKAERGEDVDIDSINLAELERRTGITRARLRRLKENNFKETVHGRTGTTAKTTVLTGFTAVLDNMLKQGITNSNVCFERLERMGYLGGKTTVKEYIRKHKDLVPAPRQLVAPQGSRGYRYQTNPGECFQMDWGFTNVTNPEGVHSSAACFAMICHHCGKQYVEFFPNAKQENLFIGMLHAFMYMGVPRSVLTDNMKSVVIKRDFEGHPVWQKDYEAFMRTVGFSTSLCKPRHPFTKGKVERLVRFVKDNFLAGRTFWTLSDLNLAAFEWCENQNSKYRKEIGDIPNFLHAAQCNEIAYPLKEEPSIANYLCPERRISFDGFVNFEGRRFGVPFRYAGKIVRICRKKDEILIYTPDFSQILATYDVTWSRKDRYCEDQYLKVDSPEEFPTMPVKTNIRQLPSVEKNIAFDKFNFAQEAEDNE